jgi:predicted nucleotidyltransferase
MESDWKELIELLQSHGVEFMVVGAHALAFFGRPRYTEDLDLFLRMGSENQVALQSALKEFGITISDDRAKKLMFQDRQMMVLGHEPHAVDLLNFLDGLDFDSAWKSKVEGSVFGVKAWIISKEDFIKTKLATGRKKDLLDLELLREIEQS